eukprot:1191539-Prorocentrum_minimum.AAC.3
MRRIRRLRGCGGHLKAVHGTNLHFGVRLLEKAPQLPHLRVVWRDDRDLTLRQAPLKQPLQ